jgi:hypothetical protein
MHARKTREAPRRAEKALQRPEELLAVQVREAQRRDAGIVARAADRELRQRDADFDDGVKEKHS